MLIAREILNMFEFSRNQKIALFVDKHFDECPLSQQRSVPTDRQTLSMHRYLQSQGSLHSVATPLKAKLLILNIGCIMYNQRRADTTLIFGIEAIV